MFRNQPWNAFRTLSLLLGLTFSLLLANGAMAATEDIVHLTDGRVLHGQIVKETNGAVIFDYLNPDIGISVTMTLPKASILKIDRDVVLPDADEPASSSSSQAKPKPASGESESSAPESSVQSEDVATFYVIPMHGQIGTDIRSGLYEDAIEEIKSLSPDFVIIELDSSMNGDTMINYWMGGNVDTDTWKDDPYRRKELITSLMDDEEKMVLDFHQQIPKDIRQVMWVKDATGPAALLALSWEDMYMHPDGDLGSLGEIWSMIQFPDPDVRSKMQKAWFGAAKGMMSYGGHPEALLHGLLDPTGALSFSCKGREPVWYNNFNGDIPIRPDFGYGAEIRHVRTGNIMFGYEFSATPCEDLLISDGTASNLNDLALLLNVREYRRLETDKMATMASYQEVWRAKLDRALEALKEYTKYIGRGTIADLQKARKALARLTGLVRTDES
ncbi:MAG: hypothetical protein P8L37_08385, partial [Phycisphaerales bacterium]|nr:hypothetical protein [Phycisphaerales bacterium]